MKFWMCRLASCKCTMPFCIPITHFYQEVKQTKKKKENKKHLITYSKSLCTNTWHSIQPPLFFLLGRGDWTSNQILKKRCLIRSQFLDEELLRKRAWPFSGGGSFYMKNKLNTEIFNDKKVYKQNKQKCFSLS